jgi:hypothetical protein
MFLELIRGNFCNQVYLHLLDSTTWIDQFLFTLPKYTIFCLLFLKVELGDQTHSILILTSLFIISFSNLSKFKSILVFFTSQFPSVFTKRQLGQLFLKCDQLTKLAKLYLISQNTTPWEIRVDDFIKLIYS